MPFMPTPTRACFPLTAAREAQLRAALVREAKSWDGTPYVQLADVKGPKGAVDCSMLLVRSVVDAGIFEPFDPRPYEPGWHLHHDEEKYLAWLETIGVEIEASQAQGGDVMACRFGLCFSHGGVLIDRTRVVHALMQHGRCSVTDLHEAFLLYERPEGGSVRRPWAKRPRKFFDLFAGIRRWATQDTKTIEDCRAKLSNVERFAGLPWVPEAEH